MVSKQYSHLFSTKIMKISESRYLSSIISFHVRFFFPYYCLPRRTAVLFLSISLSINARSLRQGKLAEGFYFFVFLSGYHQHLLQIRNAFLSVLRYRKNIVRGSVLNIFYLFDYFTGISYGYAV